MGLSTVTFERFTCDRCEKAEDIPCGNVDLRAKWGHASAQGYQGKQLFWLDYKITLCPECCASLQDWAAPRPAVASEQHQGASSAVSSKDNS